MENAERLEIPRTLNEYGETNTMIAPEELTSNIIHDRLAATYGLAYDANFTAFLKYLLLERFTRPSDVCLDVGIGNGIYSIPLCGRVREIHGIDICAKMLEQCRKNIETRGIRNIHIYERSATNLLFDDASFDVVFSFSTLLLVPNPERAYHEIARVLKVGGIAVLDITGSLNLSRVYWAKYYRRHGHNTLNHYRLEKIRAIFNSLGFQIVETHSTGILDQWKYVKGLSKLTFLDRLFHSTTRKPDLDYRISQSFPSLANRWYFVLKKCGA